MLSLEEIQMLLFLIQPNVYRKPVKGAGNQPLADPDIPLGEPDMDKKAVRKPKAKAAPKTKGNALRRPSTKELLSSLPPAQPFSGKSEDDLDQYMDEVADDFYDENSANQSLSKLPEIA